MKPTTIILINAETNERKEIKSDAKVLGNISDYFKCMFNGKFNESSQNNIEIHYDDIETATAFLEFINSDEEEIKFKTGRIELFRLLDLTEYWLMLDYVYDWCADEIGQNWYKYDLQKLFPYMEKYKFNRLSIDFDKCEQSPIELMTLAKATPFLDNIEMGCILELQGNPKFTIVDELNFYLHCIQKNSKYIEKVRDIFDDLEDEEIKYRQTCTGNEIRNELILAPNLKSLNLKVFEYFKPDPEKEYEYMSDYSDDEQLEDDIKHYKQVCLTILEKISDTETSEYLIEQIDYHKYYDLISYKFVAKLCDHAASKELGSEFAKRFLTQRKPDMLLLVKYIAQ